MDPLNDTIDMVKAKEIRDWKVTYLCLGWPRVETVRMTWGAMVNFIAETCLEDGLNHKLTHNDRQFIFSNADCSIILAVYEMFTVRIEVAELIGEVA